jgi:hypothetical protein
LVGAGERTVCGVPAAVSSTSRIERERAASCRCSYRQRQPVPFLQVRDRGRVVLVFAGVGGIGGRAVRQHEPGAFGGSQRLCQPDRDAAAVSGEAPFHRRRHGSQCAKCGAERRLVAVSERAPQTENAA